MEEQEERINDTDTKITIYNPKTGKWIETYWSFDESKAMQFTSREAAQAQLDKMAGLVVLEQDVPELPIE